MPHDYIPQNDARFYEWSRILIEYISNHLGVWAIPTTMFEPVFLLFEGFVAAYNKTEDPNHGKVDTLKKRQERTKFEKALRKFLKSFVTYNPAVTNADKGSMGLPIPKPRSTYAPTLMTYPVAEIDTSRLRQLFIHFRDHESTSKAKPKGVYGVEIRWAILDSPPVEVEDMTNTTFCVRSPCILTFGKHERGKRIYLCLRWITTRGEKSPWGEIYSAIIP
ncbi:MAG: hypothetical protein LBK82_14400 [Planctomycetaceae bacterium]|nr:hypothetical protein [Planctomycetaceae bacterium]